MWSYILKRLLLMIPTLLGVLTLTFIVIQFVPGGPVEQMQHELRKGAENGAPFGLRAHSGVDAQQLAQLKQLYGFDKPPLERYVLMLKRFSTFDLGQSYFRHQSVWSLIVSKLPVSISIGLWTFFLTYLISVPLGIAKAVRNGSRFDIATSLVVLIGYAIPGFVLGVLLLVLFGGGTFLQLFPLRNLTSDNWAQLSLGGKIVDYLWHITLPITASVVGSFAVVTMLTKNAFLDEIRKQYVLTARAKGLSEKRVLWKHVFLGTDDRGRDLFARLLYGFRVSVEFGLVLTLIGTILGIAAGAVQGYFGGRIDIVGQRLIEIWSAMPELYLLIIFSSIFEPGFILLIVLLSLFGWIGLSDYVRAEFLRNRHQDYVRAARAMGLSNWQIMWRHVLPNSLTPVITFLPFRMSGAILALTASRLPRPRRAGADA